MRQITVVSFSCIALSVFSVSTYASNIVVNGSFEATPTYGVGAGPFGGDTFDYPNCNSLNPCVAVPNWTTQSSLSILFTPANIPTLLDGGGLITAADGNNFVGSDAAFGTEGPISQTLTGLTVGQSYTLSFDQAAGELGGNYADPSTDQWIVTVGGTLASSPTTITLPDSSTIGAYVVNGPDDSWTTPLITLNAVISNPSSGFSGWQAESYSFTASATSELLAFMGVGSPQGGPPLALLDNVDVEASSGTSGTSSTPEPKSFALALLGAGLLAAVVIHRQRRA